MYISIFGATSDVAQQLAKLFTQKGDEVTLFGIEAKSLKPLQSDLEVRYNDKVNLGEFDLLQYKSPHTNLIELIQNSDIAIMLIGYLGNQGHADSDDSKLNRIIALNYAKVVLSVYLDGLRNRLYPKGVHVVTLKPVFMATKMTQGLSLPKFLTASPEAAAKQIVRAVQTKRNKAYINPLIN